VADAGPSPLLRELLDWVAARPRTYGETMDAWRSTCPRHTVWEDALLERLVEVRGAAPLRDGAVRLTVRGEQWIGGGEEAARSATGAGSC
jgi:hypothetical protein